MKHKGLLGLTVVVAVMGLAGCHKSAAELRPASQRQTLLHTQKQTLTHNTVENVGKNVHVLIPQTSQKKALVDADTYVAAAKRELKAVKGEAATKAAYVTFKGQKGLGDIWRLTPTVRVYQKDDQNKTKVKRIKELPSVNVDMAKGTHVTVASLATGSQQLQAINYHALVQAVKNKHYTADQLKQARGITFLKDMNADNFKLTSTHLTIYPKKNALGIKQVALSMSDIEGYMNKLVTVKEPDFGNKKVIALTFDDGPNPKTTPKVLKILKDNGIKGTFFMVGYEVKANPSLAKSVVDNGNEVGTHTYDHPNLATLSPVAALQEVNSAADAMYNAIGTLPTMLRPPYGAVNAAHDGNIPLPSIQWAVDSEDWKVHSPGPIITRINSSVYAGSIILMHDIHPQSVAALPQVIKSLKAKGYSFVTVSELLGKYLLPGEQYFGTGNHRAI